MRIIKFKYKDRAGWGVVEGLQARILAQPPFERIKFSKQRVALNKIKLLAPCLAGKIILCGLNYCKHAQELGLAVPGEPVIFLKPASALLAHKQKIIYPPGVSRLDYEAELALVIKKPGRNIPANKAADFILGFTCLNDVTARGLQKKDGQWTRSKSFDTFCPLGPWLETQIEPGALNIRAYLNSKIVQDSNTADFIFPVDYLVSFISRVMTLLPGDVISTGTPAGIGPMQPGDTIEIEIEGIGKLKNYLAKDRER